MDRESFERQRLAALLRQFFDAPGQIVSQIFGRAATIVGVALLVLGAAHLDTNRDIYGARARRFVSYVATHIQAGLEHVKQWETQERGAADGVD